MNPGPADGIGATPRPSGRPRDPVCEQAICRATLDLLAESGLAGLTIEAVAARAGVGKATIYRRWSGKDELLIDAVARLTEPVRPALRGNLRDDLVVLLDALSARSRSSQAARILPRLLGEGVSHPEVLRHYREQVIVPRRKRIAEVLRGGIAAGELRADLDTDIEFAIDLLVGPVIYRLLTRPDEALPADLPERLVDAVLAGLRPR
ncbi:MAG: TetR/AcrR family transcriptional regulator [Frankiaceae bacterium]